MNIVFPNMPVTSAQLSNSIIDETGTGSVVLNTSPTLVTPVLTGTVSGSTAAGGTLTLTGTSSATKSATGIKLGSVVTIDEVNGMVGATGNLSIGTAVAYGATTTPTMLDLGNSYSSDTAAGRLKIRFHPSGDYGLTVGSSSDMQARSDGRWDTYIASSLKTRITSTGLAVTGVISATGTISTGGYTVATLPAGVTGARAYVTDATSPTYNGALTGGGTVVVPVFYNGSAWVSA